MASRVALRFSKSALLNSPESDFLLSKARDHFFMARGGLRSVSSHVFLPTGPVSPEGPEPATDPHVSSATLVQDSTTVTGQERAAAPYVKSEPDAMAGSRLSAANRVSPTIDGRSELSTVWRVIPRTLHKPGRRSPPRAGLSHGLYIQGFGLYIIRLGHDSGYPTDFT